MSFRHPAEIAAEIDVLRMALDAMHDVRGVPLSVERAHGCVASMSTRDESGSEDDGARMMRERRNFDDEAIMAKRQIRNLRVELRASRSAWPMGCEDVASMLGVKLGTVHMWVKRSAIVARDGTIGGAPWWWRETVAAWAVATGRLDADRKSTRLNSS